MREDRVKFKEIPMLRAWIGLLIEERDLNLNIQNTELSKINAGEYAENDDKLFAVTKDELMQRIKQCDEENAMINHSIRNKKFEQRLLLKQRDKQLQEYKMDILSICWKVNRTETKNISTGSEVLGRVVSEIRANRLDDNNKMNVVFKLSDGSIYKLGIGLDKVISFMIPNF